MTSENMFLPPSQSAEVLRPLHYPLVDGVIVFIVIGNGPINHRRNTGRFSNTFVKVESIYCCLLNYW